MPFNPFHCEIQNLGKKTDPTRHNQQWHSYDFFLNQTIGIFDYASNYTDTDKNFQEKSCGDDEFMQPLEVVRSWSSIGLEAGNLITYGEEEKRVTQYTLKKLKKSAI